MRAKFMIPAAVAGIAIAGCNSHTATSTNQPTAATRTAVPVQSAATQAAAATSATYPGQAADAALCKTYNADMASGAISDIQTALLQADGSVTPALAQDVQAVVNGGTFQQDEQNQIYVAMDCALVNAGKQPVELKK